MTSPTENHTKSAASRASDRMRAHRRRPWETLARLVDAEDRVGLEDYLRQLSTSEQALAFSRLDESRHNAVLTILPSEEAAEILCHLSETQAADMVDQLSVDDAAAIVRELPSDGQADLIGDLDGDHAEAILDAMPPGEAQSLRELTAYPDNVAGGLLVREVLQFDQGALVKDVIATLSENAAEFRDYDVQYAYLTDANQRLVGVLPMRNLLFAPQQTSVSQIMIDEPLSIRDTTSLDELRDFFDAHHFLGVPVVDQDERLLGVVHRGAVDYEMTRAAESDYLKSQGIIGGEELRTMPVLQRARRRLSWLSLNIGLNMIAAMVIAFYQDTLQQVIALAVFLPIISDMSGCSGNQAVAVTMRELSLGLIRPTEIVLVWCKEISVGMINGLALGALVFVVATVWNGNPYLGVVVGVALMLNTLIAVSIGGTVPLLLRRFGMDPAVASGPLLTTVTDMCGFLIVLGLATMMLSRLVG